MSTESREERSEELFTEKGFEIRKELPCFIDITLFTGAVLQFYSVADKKIKKAQIEKIFACHDWYIHHTCKSTGRCVYLESANSIEYKHELYTAVCLTQVGYDVLFAPKGMFGRHEKKFDVFLIKGIIMLKADLKSVISKVPNNIANRIIEGSTQASRVVLHILGDISPKALIDALRSGCYKNSRIVEVLLIYRNRLHVLPKNLIISKRIFDILK